MTTAGQTVDEAPAARSQIICELDSSVRAEETVAAAIAHCREHDAEVVFVWVLEPRLFRSLSPVAVGAVGTWGLPGVLHQAVERARSQGVVSSSVVRIGGREQMLRSQEALGAEVVFRVSDPGLSARNGRGRPIGRAQTQSADGRSFGGSARTPTPVAAEPSRLVRYWREECGAV